MAIGAEARLGFDSAIGLAEETTYGTAVTTAAQFIKFTSESMKENVTEVLIPTINTQRSYIDRFLANVEVGGSIEFPFHPIDGIKFLKHAMGGTITAATEQEARDLYYEL